ncbi:MAG: alanine--tRNA ligase [Chitinophagales bacterium]|nr:alanine--tRNA ligase [Chitinophagales bacterium]
MQYKSAKEIRKAFLDFFQSKQHLIVPSAPVVVKDDPTLMFTNAGMNQFKDYFLGNKIAPSPRIADTQKCLRVSGKHNDLEEVGVDTYHHTLFEMLGNWSFGDYFKEEAIAWSWELLTEVLGLPKDRLYATVFEGDVKEGIPADNEALEYWKKWLPEERILFGNKKDNFWEMGDTGPCGPCTEIHVDCRPDEEIALQPGSQLVNADHPQVIEIWNNVFIQFNRKKDGSLELLPAQHVDTGMGFERLVRVIQGKSSNYDTDVFSGTIAATERLTGLKYDGSDSKQAIAFRVIADHIRAVSFAISDGQLPSNTGAGYVIRRILRRAVRYYFSSLDRNSPLLHELVAVIAEQFEGVFPELKKQESFVSKVIYEEESNFLRTLDAGLKRIDVIIRENNDKVISGHAAFELFDTFGFPLDLIRLVASEHGFDVDEKGFDVEMEQQKARSRAATEIDMSDWVVLAEGENKFKGYNTLETHSKLLKYRKVKAKGKELFQLVLDQTPFYAESGGQVGDKGKLFFGAEIIEVIDTKKDMDLIIHFTEQLPQNPSTNIQAVVNQELRKATAIHHSVTHLLQSALRSVLGNHVEQKGSLNNSDYLRFDFSHFSKLSIEEIQKVENIVNDKILQNIPVVIKEMSKDEALKLGATALFGEKYGEIVRVVMMDPNFSIELCGGTHVANTGEIGLFKIIAETAIAAGVRRIEAVAGQKVIELIRDKENYLNQISETLKYPQDINKSVLRLIEENTSMKAQISQLQTLQLKQLKQKINQSFENHNDISFVVMQIDDLSLEATKQLATELRQEKTNAIIIFAGVNNEKPYITIGISDELVNTKDLNASKMVKALSINIKGGGGGQSFMATAGGQDIKGVSKVVSSAREIINNL